MIASVLVGDKRRLRLKLANVEKWTLLRLQYRYNAMCFNSDTDTQTTGQSVVSILKLIEQMTVQRAKLRIIGKAVQYHNIDIDYIACKNF